MTTRRGVPLRGLGRSPAAPATEAGARPIRIVPATAPRRSVGRRRRANVGAWAMGFVALALMVAPVLSILVSVVGGAIAHWQWSVLTESTLGTGGGLANAIVGTVVIVVAVLLCAGAVGIAGGVYLAELCPPGRAPLLRGASEVLSGVPSIVLGYVGYTVLVVALHWGFSLLGAVIVLSVMIMPYVVKATETALMQVPSSYREGADALGFRQGRVLRTVVLRPAFPGIATGLIVAVAIALGETAPLLYTAGWSDGLPSGHLLHAPIGYLPYAVWTFYNSSFSSQRQLSHDAAFLLILLVVGFLFLARVVMARTQRYAPGGARPEKHARRAGTDAS